MKHKKTNEYVVILVLDFFLAGLFLMYSHLAIIYALMALTFIAVTIHPLRRWIAAGFDFITGLIGKIISGATLTVFYYGFMTPLAFIKKIVGKPSASFKMNKDTASWYVKTSKDFNKEEFEKLW